MASARTRMYAVPALVLALTVAGCSATNPITSLHPYSPSDGIRVELSETLTAENLLVISAAEGAAGSFIDGLTNSSGDDVRVTVAAQGADDVTVHVPAGVTVLLGSADDAPAELDTVGVPPGAVLPVTISTPQGGSHEVSLPVLDGTLPEYADLVPTAGPTAS